VLLRNPDRELAGPPGEKTKSPSFPLFLRGKFCCRNSKGEVLLAEFKRGSLVDAGYAPLQSVLIRVHLWMKTLFCLFFMRINLQLQDA